MKHDDLAEFYTEADMEKLLVLAWEHEDFQKDLEELKQELELELKPKKVLDWSDWCKLFI